MIVVFAMTWGVGVGKRLNPAHDGRVTELGGQCNVSGISCCKNALLGA
jgi:hypothetical protein